MTHETMKRVPSYLKGLVATRGRADAHVQRLEGILQEVQAQVDKARRERDACDSLIRAYSSELDPTCILPVRAWRGKYGARGAVTNEIRSFVQAAQPAAVSTAEVTWHLVMKFEMDFINTEARDRWKKTSVRNRLRELAAKGVVERVAGGDDEVEGRQSSSWRWAEQVASSSLDALAEAAQASGLAVAEGTTKLE
ncbi:MAG: hypothetical protein KGL99_16880 [Burkholderiales bacterium]|nr:hypothetical protein [Burkholderiales bacterium]